MIAVPVTADALAALSVLYLVPTPVPIHGATTVRQGRAYCSQYLYRPLLLRLSLAYSYLGWCSHSLLRGDAVAEHGGYLSTSHVGVSILKLVMRYLLARGGCLVKHEYRHFYMS